MILLISILLIVYLLNCRFDKEPLKSLHLDECLDKALNQMAIDGTAEERRNNEASLMRQSFEWMEQKGVDMRNIDPLNLDFLFQSFLEDQQVFYH